MVGSPGQSLPIGGLRVEKAQKSQRLNIIEDTGESDRASKSEADLQKMLSQKKMIKKTLFKKGSRNEHSESSGSDNESIDLAYMEGKFKYRNIASRKLSRYWYIVIIIANCLHTLSALNNLTSKKDVD